MTAARALPLLALALLAGAAAAVTVVAVRVVEVPADGHVDGRVDAPADGDPPEPEDVRVGPGAPADPPPDRRTQRPRAGGGATDAAATAKIVPLPPGTTDRLSSDDPDVRHAEALSLLRRGPEVLGAVHRLRPTTPEGVDLTSRLERALDAIRRIRLSPDYGEQPQHLRDEVRLRWWATVVPEPVLAAERLAFLAARVAANPERVAAGGIAAEQAMLDEIELAHLRFEAGECDAAEFGAVLAEREEKVRAWIAKARDPRNPTGPDPAELARRLDAAVAARVRDPR